MIDEFWGAVVGAVMLLLGLYMTAGCGASAPASVHRSSARQSSEAPFAPSSGTMT